MNSQEITLRVITGALTGISREFNPQYYADQDDFQAVTRYIARVRVITDKYDMDSLPPYWRAIKKMVESYDELQTAKQVMAIDHKIKYHVNEAFKLLKEKNAVLGKPASLASQKQKRVLRITGHLGKAK